MHFQLIEAFQADNRTSRMALAEAKQLIRPMSYIKQSQLDRDRMINIALEDLTANVRDVPQFLEATTMAFQHHNIDVARD